MSYNTSAIHSFSSKATKVERRVSIQVQMANVYKRVGFSSTNNLYLTYKHELGFAPVSIDGRFARKGMWGGISCKYTQ